MAPRIEPAVPWLICAASGLGMPEGAVSEQEMCDCGRMQGLSSDAAPAASSGLGALLQQGRGDNEHVLFPSPDDGSMVSISPLVHVRAVLTPLQPRETLQTDTSDLPLHP